MIICTVINCCPSPTHLLIIVHHIDTNAGLDGVTFSFRATVLTTNDKHDENRGQTDVERSERGRLRYNIFAQFHSELVCFINMTFLTAQQFSPVMRFIHPH